MKKKTKIIVGILVLFLVMAVGYAIFAQTLKINGTATANGKFDLTYECLRKDEVGGTGTCAVNGNTITTTSTLTKPADCVEYTIKITNTGSIPAILKTVDSPNIFLDNPFLPSGDELYMDEATFLGGNYSIERLDSTGNTIGGIIYGDQAVEDAKITIQSGEAIVVKVAHGWVDSAILNIQQPTLPEGGATINYNLTFDFQQVTT